MNTLPVPFVSQITPGAQEHYNDCGAACALMVLRAYNLGAELTVDQIYNKIAPSGDQALSAGGLQSLLAATTFGVKNKWRVDLSLHDLYDALVDRRPIIALIHYAPLVKAGLTEKAGFLGAHFVVVVGMDIKNVSILDPYTTSGTERDIPVAIFRDTWTQCHLDGNPNGGAIVITLPIQDLSTPALPPAGVKYNLAVNGINVRTVPGGTGAETFVRTIWRGVSPTVYITTISGEWGRLADGSGWVFMSYLKVT